MSEQAAPAHKTVVGTCESVEVAADGGWHKYNIRVDGAQYPLKLSTKKPELIELAKAVGKQPAEWGFLESQGNPNPNKPGSFYMNRYLDSAVVLENGNQPQVFEAIPDEKRQHLIIRQSCLKAAVELRAATGDPGVDVPYAPVLELAERFVAWVLQEPVRHQPSATPPLTQPAGVGAYVEPDSIPF